jgi:GNAT superfamily N-acetyltransferase
VGDVGGFRAGRLDEPAVVGLLSAYETELVGMGVHLDHGSAGGVRADQLAPPRGAFLVLESDGVAVACGGVRMVAPGVAEIKRMYVDPAARGAGVARRLVAALEAAAVGLGARVARLDTGRDMAPAVALYRSCGYREIADYNGNPDAGWWFEKPL